MSPKQTPIKSPVVSRPPIVTILGHVDHGKTTLLDYIRKTNVAGGEAGGITQSIGAYEIEHLSGGEKSGRKMTFVDTPGHEAFAKMRKRGAGVADIAILVVAADDGVQPQTKEVIQMLTETNIPFVVAINKVDTAPEEVTRIKNELTTEGVLLEGYGGSVSFQEISAKTGQGVNELLDLVLLAADMTDLSVDTNLPGNGIILESKRDSKVGIIASVIIKNGTLRVGDRICAGSVAGKVKSIENVAGERVKEATPSMSVRIFGFESLPGVGDTFNSGGDATTTEVSRAVSERHNLGMKQAGTDVGGGKQLIKLILRSDVSGSLESLRHILESLPVPKTVALHVIDEGVGAITDGDVKLAIPSGAFILGFHVKPNKAAEGLAKTHNITMFYSDVVYTLIEMLEAEIKNLNKDIVKSDMEILGVFGGKNPGEQIIGGKVAKGKIEKTSRLTITRRGSELGTAEIINLQKDRANVLEIPEGSEGGLLVKTTVAIKVGDRLIAR
ncbi:MAG: translation initiation factor IF-2 [Patescibacteria group bacterium]